MENLNEVTIKDTMNTLLQSALNYAEHGFSVIPIGREKKPYISWADFQQRKATAIEINAWWEKWPNAMIGIVTGEISGLLVIDCDTQEGYSAVQELIPDSLIMPTVRTPRGGWHLYFSFPQNHKITVGTGIMPNVDYRGSGGYIVAPPSINGDGKSYKWVEGLSLCEVETPPLPDALLSLIITNKEYGQDDISKKDGQHKSVLISSNQQMFIDGRRDDDLFHTANCLIKGGAKTDEVSYILNILGKYCNPPFPQNEIPLKIQSALARVERCKRNIAQDVREWVEVSDGHFKVSDYYRESGIVSKQDKHAAIVEFHNLRGRVIERYGNERGAYRCIENECENIDFLNASTEFVDIRFPFEIERLVKTLPKNIIIIAGEPNAGKTAFLLNVVEMNQSKHNITYFSSEMGSIELKDRLKKFEAPLSSWSFNAKERSSNFADVIRPNEINIIDFLEIHDEFYKIGGMIKEIYDKLDKGIAIIAIQKNKSAEFGLGGNRGLEKARLYLTMEPNHLKIIKGKNWTDSTINPNNMQIDFKLVQGCKFLQESDWYKQAN